jgi:hypothetical protein
VDKRDERLSIAVAFSFSVVVGDEYLADHREPLTTSAMRALPIVLLFRSGVLLVVAGPCQSVLTPPALPR